MRRGHALIVGLCALAAAGAVGCGGGERQDAGEEEASYEVEVLDVSFPERQRLAQESELAITVRNDADEAIPNVAVTLDGLYARIKDRDLADPERPVFVLDSVPKEIGGSPDAKLAAPGGDQTALVDTWALGRLEPGAERTFRWKLKAVRPGPYELTYAVAAGLHGKAKAVGAGGAQPRGEIAGTISADAPRSRIAADGSSVVTSAP